MRLAAIGLGVLGVACAILTGFHSDPPTTFIITGDLRGHLEPCGCTLPMSGGIKRLASLVRQLKARSDVVLLVNGAMSENNTPRDVLKTEALAQAYGALDATAVNLSREDAKMNSRISEYDSFLHHRLISGSIEPSDHLSLNALSSGGSVLVGGVSMHPENLAFTLNEHAVATSESIQKLLAEARQQSLIPALLLDGTEAEAEQTAKTFPALRLIVYRSAGDPPANPISIGQTLLVTPGEEGKSVVRLSLDGGEFSAYQRISLGPSFPDDPQVSRLYSEYLTAVTHGGFLDRVTRLPSAAFTGSNACGSCHKSDLLIWEHSKHSRAFASLEVQGHAADPDCVRCHVVGLMSIGGFRSRRATPNLASVGCESCHGPGAAHAHNPKAFKLPKIKLDVCMGCHTAEQSPNFNAMSAWRHDIRHH